MNKIIAIMLVSGALNSCMTSGYHQNAIDDKNNSNLTVGVVQKDIKIGMAKDQVAAILGAPNIVSTLPQGGESWIYDRIASEVTYSRSSVSGGAMSIILGPFRSALGGIAPSASGDLESGAQRTSQKSLTVIIYFDDKNQVREFKYHSSKF